MVRKKKKLDGRAMSVVVAVILLQCGGELVRIQALKFGRWFRIAAGMILGGGLRMMSRIRARSVALLKYLSTRRG